MTQHPFVQITDPRAVGVFVSSLITSAFADETRLESGSET